MIDIKSASAELKETMEESLKKAIEYAEDIKFQKINLDFRILKKLDGKIEFLENVIYIIAIKEDCKVKANTICSAVISFKEDKKIKFPKVNDFAANSSNKILYIGKSKGKLKGRFVSHLSINSPSVYGLHLEYWQKNPELNKLELDLYYANIDLRTEDIDSEILELLETSLHKKYKPILGRSGH